MIYTPYPYQTEAINHAVDFFHSNEKYNAFEILPTGSGKSVVIANILKQLSEPTLVFQPSKEILEQNVKKYMSYGFRAGVYSASLNSKYIEKGTFATIGSVVKKKHLFKNTKNIIIDECHLVNSDDGMYHDFIKSLPGAKVLGLTATPYRLTSSFEGAELKFLNTTNPRIFEKVIYYVQNQVLFDSGNLAPLEYFSFDVINRSMLEMNANGSDFTDASLRNYYKQINMPQVIANYVNKILSKRKNLLVFCSLISEAISAAQGIPGAVVVTGETETSVRERILAQFQSGIIPCVINVGVLTTGFDYPGLEAVMLGRSTMSLSLYYQMIGRVMRSFTYPDGTKKKGWVIDLGANINFFGKIETMLIEQTPSGVYYISNNGKQLTNVPFSKN